jgi:hypothetical protein
MNVALIGVDSNGGEHATVTVRESPHRGKRLEGDTDTQHVPDAVVAGVAQNAV